MEEFETKREFWYYIGMVVFAGLAVMFFIFLVFFGCMCDDLVDRVQSQNETIDELTYDANRYKMLYEEMYDMHQYCIESGGEYTCQTKSEK